MRERTEVRDRISSEVQSCDLVRAEQVNLLCRTGATSLRNNNFRKDLRNLELLIVAVGGDGTVNEVARGLLEAQKAQQAQAEAKIEASNSTALGIIPRGSGNGLARHLGIKPLNKIQNFAPTSTSLIDHATINNHPFFCTAGIGFDALVSKKYAENNTHKRGALKYIKTALKSYFSYKPEKYLITINGKTHERTAFLITFANASQWGNNGYIAPMADISDGLIDVAIVKKFPITAVPRLIYQLMTKKLHKSPYVRLSKVVI